MNLYDSALSADKCNTVVRASTIYKTNLVSSPVCKQETRPYAHLCHFDAIPCIICKLAGSQGHPCIEVECVCDRPSLATKDVHQNLGIQLGVPSTQVFHHAPAVWQAMSAVVRGHQSYCCMHCSEEEALCNESSCQRESRHHASAACQGISAVLRVAAGASMLSERPCTKKQMQA